MERMLIYFYILSLSVYSLPLSAFGIPFNGSLTFLMSFVIVACFLCRVIYGHKFKVSLLLISFAILTYMTASIAYGLVLYGKLSLQALLYLKNALLFTVFLNYLHNRSFFHIATKAFKDLALLCAFLTFLQMLSVTLFSEIFFGLDYQSYIRITEGVLFRASPLNGDPNYFAVIMLPGLMLFTHGLFERNGSQLFPVVIVVLGLILTQSRGAILAYVLSSLFIVIFLKRIKYRALILIGTSIFSIPLIVFVVLSRNAAGSGLFKERFENLRVSLDGGYEGGLFGRGWSSSIIDGGDWVLVPHNFLLEIFVAGGSSALAFFLASLFVMLLNLNRYSYVKWEQTSVLVAFLFAAMFLSVGIYAFTPIIMAYALSILYVSNRRLNLGSRELY